MQNGGKSPWFVRRSVIDATVVINSDVTHDRTCIANVCCKQNVFVFHKNKYKFLEDGILYELEGSVTYV